MNDDLEDEFETKITVTDSSINPDEVADILKNIFDPEIDYSIYDLGLIYEILLTSTSIDIIMTLTSANCPEAVSIPEEVRFKLKEKWPDLSVNVEVIFEPPWTVENMTDEIKLKVGLL